MSPFPVIGLISATRQECGLVLAILRRTGHENFYTGKIGSNKVVSVISGMGKTNASHAATLLIEKFSPSFVINFGIGGAYPSSGLRAGDIAIADTEIYGDEGLLLEDGFHKADEIGIPLLKKGRKKFFNEFPLNKNLVKKAINLLRFTPHASRLTIKTGSFLTVSTCTGTNKKAKELEKRFSALGGGPICENMEGAAVAHICAMHDVPFLELRGISNIVGERDRSKWDIKMAAENCQKAVLAFLKALKR